MAQIIDFPYREQVLLRRREGDLAPVLDQLGEAVDGVVTLCDDGRADIRRIMLRVLQRTIAPPKPPKELAAHVAAAFAHLDEIAAGRAAS